MENLRASSTKASVERSVIRMHGGGRELRGSGEVVHHAVELGRPAGTVDQRNPIKQETRRKAAQDEVLEARLTALLSAQVAG